jgi:uncharacterized protein (TIGR03437 family)
VNFLAPASVGNGPAQVTITSSSGSVATGSVTISSVAPAVFAAGDSTVAAAQAVRVSQNGTQTPVNVVECGTSSCTASPVDLGAATDSVFLTLFGTGLRKNSGLANIHALVGGIDSPVAFAGAQGQFVGLDQVNVILPQALRGRGSVPIVLTIDGQTTNTVTINVR